MTTLTDLFEFLHSPNPDARQVALTNLVGHTPKGSAQRTIFIPSLSAPTFESSQQQQQKAQSIPVVIRKPSPQDAVKLEMLQDLKMLCRDQAHIAHDAYSALVNLSDTLAVARHLVNDDFLTFIVSYTANHTSPLSPLAAMLLSNISSHPSLTPLIPSLAIPIISIAKPTQPQFPRFYYPYARSASATVHPDFRPMMEESLAPVGSQGGVEWERGSVEAIRCLVQAFEEGAAEGVERGDKDAKRKGSVHFLASVFANVSMIPQTRPLLLLPFPAFPKPATKSNESPEDEPLLTKIVVYTEHPDTIRRGGALGCIKNAAMDRASHPFLLATEADRVPLPSNPSRKVKGVDVLPWVLSPLMGPEEIDMDDAETLPETLQLLGLEKKREQDPVLRLMCVEILLLLATSYTGREQLRTRGTYVVIKLAHEAEKDEKIGEHMIRLVGLLKRDEGQETERDHLAPLEFGTAGGRLEQDDSGFVKAAKEEEEEGDSDLEIEVI